ncbi:hypothetical protein Poli38472_007743 [Pythium oligandrum]|uniref:hydroxyacylglutathione hydrolase n=1 Tax=Pythium oligandrum TaxID=41045 RepID=A0A8K1FMB8_PYTOL|nr:hypothetical protein Poli38472_007743 [Pythium oligandrum]|eukprot:TMW68071.1 hypothetical protein Poli38472_007743 [Pythium oligandrum]
MDVVAIPVLSDNYAYLLIDTSNHVAAAVDPVEADKVYARAKELGVTIVSILTTHEHWDHAGGNESLQKLIADEEQRSVEVYGGKDDNVQAMTKVLVDNDVVKVGDLSVQVFHTPCHTRGHVLYLCEGSLFTGDTLFIAGCGRFFMGTPAEMQHALNEVIAKLPTSTKVYCGHEYTLSNLRFAAHVEPQNEAIQKKLAWAAQQAETKTPTIPSTVEEELATNPFMRVNEPDVQRFAGGKTDPVEVMGALRSAKDNFGIGNRKL